MRAGIHNFGRPLEQPKRVALTGTLDESFKTRLRARLETGSEESHAAGSEAPPGNDEAAWKDGIVKLLESVPSEGIKDIKTYHEKIRSHIREKYPAIWDEFSWGDAGYKGPETNTMYNIINGSFFDGIGDIVDKDARARDEVSKLVDLAAKAHQRQRVPSFAVTSIFEKNAATSIAGATAVVERAKEAADYLKQAWNVAQQSKSPPAALETCHVLKEALESAETAVNITTELAAKFPHPNRAFVEIVEPNSSGEDTARNFKTEIETLCQDAKAVHENVAEQMKIVLEDGQRIIDERYPPKEGATDCGIQ